MSFFRSDSGKKYYPFGRGGRMNLLKGFSQIASQSVAAVATAAATQYDEAAQRLRVCPLICLPLSLDCASLSPTVEGDADSDIEEKGLTRSSATMAVLPTAEVEVGAIPSSPSMLAPVVVRLPQSESAVLFDELSGHLIDELFKLQVDTFTVCLVYSFFISYISSCKIECYFFFLQIPTVHYVESKQILLLRYFTASSAVEFSVPVSELRQRDPATGRRIIPLASSSSSHQSPSSQVSSSSEQTPLPVKLETKGRYGVGILWDDGYHADIFSFDVLKRIALDISSAK
jgi:hypothetical protein